MHDIYLKLYDRACILSGIYIPTTHGEARISYNLGMTSRAMVLCPRTSEGDDIGSGDGKVTGKLSLNGTVLGGTMLVKSEKEFKALLDNETIVEDILGHIGIPSTNEDEDHKL